MVDAPSEYIIDHVGMTVELPGDGVAVPKNNLVEVIRLEGENLEELVVSEMPRTNLIAEHVSASGRHMCYDPGTLTSIFCSLQLLH